jgi:zinc transporter ZupT
LNGELYTWLVAIHAHLAVLGLAVLLHPVISLRRRNSISRNMLLTADLGALLLLLPYLMGWAIYPSYRRLVKPWLWIEAPGAVLRFESKEHLAAMAVALAVAGALTLRLAGRRPAGREAAWILLLCGWALGFITALLGIYVRGVAQPGF